MVNIERKEMSDILKGREYGGEGRGPNIVQKKK